MPTLTATGEGDLGDPFDARFAKRYATMEAVFDAVDAAIEGEPDSWVDYSARWGYPQDFSWGVAYVTDSTTRFEVVDVQALP